MKSTLFKGVHYKIYSVSIQEKSFSIRLQNLVLYYTWFVCMAPRSYVLWDDYYLMLSNFLYIWAEVVLGQTYV